MTKKKTILILGAAGLLGNIISRKLSKSYEIIGFSHKKNQNKNIIKSDYDIFSSKEDSFLKKADIIINCIGENSDEAKMKKINMNILKKVAIKINHYKKKKIFIHISTCGVYGNLANSLIDEETTPKPETKYSRTKHEGEEILKSVLKKYTKLIILRPSQVIGTTMKNTSLKKLYNFIKRKLFFFVNNKSAVFSYIFADDLIIVIDRLIKLKKHQNIIYNISNKITYEKLVKIIQNSLKQKFYYPSINPLFIKLIIYVFNDILKIKIPINSKTLHSLMAETTFKSFKIRNDLNVKKFININSKNLRTLINE
tara:strand:+ start:16 stop:948 length:933 start_codon:yes stop_codon:yes gene_type:complete